MDTLHIGIFHSQFLSEKEVIAWQMILLFLHCLSLLNLFCLALAFCLAEVQVGSNITLGILGLCSYISVSIYDNKHFFLLSGYLIRVWKLAQGCLNISRTQFFFQLHKSKPRAANRINTDLVLWDQNQNWISSKEYFFNYLREDK